MRCFSKNPRAFSIPEVMLSVFVLSIGLLAIVRLMSESLSYSIKNNDAIVASELVQEGVELIRNVRDNDIADGGTGFAAFDNSNEPKTGKYGKTKERGYNHCLVDWDSLNDALDCDRNVNNSQKAQYVLQYVSGRYVHVVGSVLGSGKFSRYVNVDYNGTSAGNDEYAIVRSFVYWDGFVLPNGGIAVDNCTITATTKCVFAEAFLTSWK